MKRLISVFLAAVMTLSVFGLCAGAAAPEFWNAAEKAVRLKTAPTITRIREEADDCGTRLFAYYHASADLKALQTYRAAYFEDDAQALAPLLGEKAESFTSAGIHVGVQVAFSFDGGKNWVNDWEDTISNINSGFYDKDDDGFSEYCYVPTELIESNKLNRSIRVLDVSGSAYTPRWCNPPYGKTVKETLTLMNQAMLQGKGIFTGKNYDPNGDYADCGFYVDFTKETITVKARYFVLTVYSLTKGGDNIYEQKLQYSDWSASKTYNGKTASYEDQGCMPDLKALLTDAPLTLSVTGQKKVNAGGIKQTAYALQVGFPAAMETALAAFSAVDSQDEWEKLTGGEYREPEVFIEIKVGDGHWYRLRSFTHNEPNFTFDTTLFYDNTDADMLQALGFQTGDPVYLRARLYGADSVYIDYEYLDAAETRFAYVVKDGDTVRIRSGVSAPVELSVSGIYHVHYELNGGTLAPDADRLTTFSDDTPNKTVDLTSARYTPTRAHYAFGGWFTDPAFAEKSRVKSFDLSEKLSRTYYAKWTALPSYTVTYDLGGATGYVANDNPTRIYTDSGTVALKDAASENEDFLGWYTAATGGTKVTSLSYTGMGKNTVLYARWKEKPAPEGTPAKWGDADANGKVEAADARLVLRCAVGLETFTLAQKAWTDVDTPDATHKISAADARIVLRMAVGLDTAAKLGLPAKPAGI